MPGDYRHKLMKRDMHSGLLSASGFFLASLLLFSCPAGAEQWYLTSSGNNGDLFFIDIEQLRSEGSGVTAWVRQYLAEPKFTGLTTPRTAQYLTLYHFDCANNRLAIEMSHSRSAEGKTIESYSSNGAIPQYADTVPNSTGGAMLRFACGRGRQLAGEGSGPRHLTPTVIPQTNWLSSGTSSSGNQTFVSPDAISAAKNDSQEGVYFYQRTVFKKPFTSGPFTVISALTLWSSDCKSGDLKSYAEAYYGEANELLYRVESRAPRATQTGSNTIGAAMGNYVCAAAGINSRSATLPMPQNGQPAAADNKQNIYSGTAWYVDHGYFVTAQHVIANAREIRLVGPDRVAIPARIVSSDQKNDVAILAAEIGERHIRPLPVAKGTAPLGARVFTIGYPHFNLLGISPKITSGDIAGNLPQDPTKYLISVPVQSGSSGGPLINMNGDVVGLIIQKLSATDVYKTTGDLTENMNFALKSKYIDALLDEIPGRPSQTATSKPKNLAQEDLVQLYKDSIYFVLTATPAQADN